MAVRFPAQLASFAVLGANTGVGKTAISAGLAAAAARAQAGWMYLKPLQTGFPRDSDARCVARAGQCLEVEHGPHAAELWKAHLHRNGYDPRNRTSGGGSWNETWNGKGSAQSEEPPRRCGVLYAWELPASPDLACQKEGRHVSDNRLVSRIARELRTFASSLSDESMKKAMVVVEGAGGPASPGPSGTLQCDLLRPFRLPVVLVGDPRLGGISSTISAYETLLLRGYDVDAIVMMGGELGNERAIQKHVDARTEVWRITQSLQGQEPGPNVAEMDEQMANWIVATAGTFDELRQSLIRRAADRFSDLESMAERARNVFWWPFTQHKSVGLGTTVIDGRCGEQLMLFKGASSSGSGASEFQAAFDGVASWWTQGVSATQSTTLVRNIAQAAGRYGHVIFPETVHAPALELSERLLRGVGRNWASRVFFSDDGSTAVEVGLKMALRKFAVDANLLDRDENAEPLKLHVIGLQNSYHGDTLGAMQCSPPSVFNGEMQTPWYRAQGFFLDPPHAAICDGQWKVMLSEELQQKLPRGLLGDELLLSSKEEVFAEERGKNGLAQFYLESIQEALDSASEGGIQLGACIMEAVLQGAGGMNLIDPLWQRLVVQECRHRGIPVIFDEVFSGIWRLGSESAAELLGEAPDIGCYAKLLTGGMLPLSVTLAREEVFKAFEGPSKMEALLHGHSYTAHPIGCQVSVAALDIYCDKTSNPNYPGHERSEGLEGATENVGKSKLTDLWDEAMATEISLDPKVRRVLPLGTVFAVEMNARDAGYGSTASASIVKSLRSQGIFARPLGNVVYLMATPTTTKAGCRKLLAKLMSALYE
eukprot:scaffold1501_cov352-Pavlova_lutheri.AAC.28